MDARDRLARAVVKEMGRYPKDRPTQEHIKQTFEPGFPERTPVPMEESEAKLRED